MEAEKKKALQAGIDKLRKDQGAGIVMRLGESHVEDIPVIPSGAISLDMILGVGGFPRGRIVEIFGWEGSGKSTLAMHAVAEVQKQGGTALYIDAEHALDKKYAAKIGINVEDLLISQPDCGEQALVVLENMASTGAVDLIVVDSVAALTPRKEIEGEMGDAQMGAQARLMSQAMRKLTAIINNTKTCLIFINQLRNKIGIIYGSNETTTGGNALKFAATLRLDIRKRKVILNDAKQAIGHALHIKVVKNKVAPPFTECEIDLIYGHGFAKEDDIVNAAEHRQLFDKKGSWYSYQGQKIGQGRDEVKAWLVAHPSEKAAILKQIVAPQEFSISMGAGTAEAPTSEV